MAASSSVVRAFPSGLEYLQLGRAAHARASRHGPRHFVLPPIRQVARVLAQMDAAAAREYFAASLFLNYVTYENEMAERVAERIAAKAKRFSR